MRMVATGGDLGLLLFIGIQTARALEPLKKARGMKGETVVRRLQKFYA
jgi:hypothetical protein